LYHFPVVGVLRQGDSDDAPSLADWPFMGQDAIPQEAQGGRAGSMRARPVFKLDTGFDQAVVPAADDLAHARSIAAAAYVLQKQGMVKVCQIKIGEAKFAAQPHTQQAAAQGMARQ
jgi:hypothetical protein